DAGVAPSARAPMLRVGSGRGQPDQNPHQERGHTREAARLAHRLLAQARGRLGQVSVSRWIPAVTPQAQLGLGTPASLHTLSARKSSRGQTRRNGGNLARTGQNLLSDRTYVLQRTHAGAVGLRYHAGQGSLLHGRALALIRRARLAERSQAIRGALG